MTLTGSQRPQPKIDSLVPCYFHGLKKQNPEQVFLSQAVLRIATPIYLEGGHCRLRFRDEHTPGEFSSPLRGLAWPRPRPRPWEPATPLAFIPHSQSTLECFRKFWRNGMTRCLYGCKTLLKSGHSSCIIYISHQLLETFIMHRFHSFLDIKIDLSFRKKKSFIAFF